MWASLLALLSGVAGWVLAKLLADPLLAIYGLRMQAQELLILHGNIVPSADNDERNEAAKHLHEVGAALVAQHLAAWPWVTWVYRRVLHWDPYSAGELCVAFGVLTGKHGFSHIRLAPDVQALRDALRLPIPRMTDWQRRQREQERGNI